MSVVCAPGAGAREQERANGREDSMRERERRTARDLSETERERGDRRWKLCELCERESVCVCVSVTVSHHDQSLQFTQYIPV